MATNWITNRVPTKEDGGEIGYVWVTNPNGSVHPTYWHNQEVTKENFPWTHMTPPEPYIEPVKQYKIVSNEDPTQELIVEGKDLTEALSSAVEQLGHTITEIE